jgi:hypothetical protein
VAFFRREVREVVDLLLLRCDEKYVHLTLLRTRVEDLPIHLDLSEVEGDVVLGLPRDLFLELLRGHQWHRDLLDDHAVATHAERNVTVLLLVEELI